MVAPHNDDEPRIIKVALSPFTSKEWITAMHNEMESMRTNHVWDLVDLSSGHKTIGNKWVLKVKRKASGSIERYKACLVVKGYPNRWA